jgi:hypothetical protein
VVKIRVTIQNIRKNRPSTALIGNDSFSAERDVALPHALKLDYRIGCDSLGHLASVIMRTGG